MTERDKDLDAQLAYMLYEIPMPPSGFITAELIVAGSISADKIVAQTIIGSKIMVYDPAVGYKEVG